MRRGEVYWADLGPRAGRRPAVILTRDDAIPVLTSVVVAPVTTTVRGIESEVPIGPEEGLKEESAIACDGLLTVRKSRIDPQPVGSLDSSKLPALDRALRFALEIRY